MTKKINKTLQQILKEEKLELERRELAMWLEEQRLTSMELELEVEKVMRKEILSKFSLSEREHKILDEAFRLRMQNLSRKQ